MQTDREGRLILIGMELFVTYDAGESFVEVPDGYEKVCGKPNGGYDERLEDGSYLISPDFTAFLGFDSEGTVLIYSEDQVHPGMRAGSPTEDTRQTPFFPGMKEVMLLFLPWIAHLETTITGRG